ncbi:MAG: hypothetical protein EWV41_02525 [Microcystis wesenbergii Mw_MB_S_20031200_S109]|jgi:hypothetical protein|uniref:Uncharacterized protein n=1 Tax=Microcystis wesenbergii Mw_MB_S_20031200_S109D TaxID=2486241 RepID=A0A552M4S3_9CHRO|nr:MAG: hypothetical protein EWV41_02525 [Microcystis wesenbergii Mw_MB_S_20031200_S109]TRV27471.1 MAG: hypothetical protein EWV88_04800 [Microcystis wesenbergii Mw_MB_S_20031200_S109D]
MFELTFLIKFIAILLAFFAAFFAAIGNDTWENGKLTLKGYVLVIVALLAAVTQFCIQWQETKDLANRHKLYKTAYTGWVSIGLYDKNQEKWMDGEDKLWKNRNKYLIGVKKPSDLYKKDEYFMTDTMIYGRSLKIDETSKNIDNCNDFEKWMNSENNKETVFLKGQVVKIDKDKYEPNPFIELDCGNGQVRVFVKLTDGRL